MIVHTQEINDNDAKVTAEESEVYVAHEVDMAQGKVSHVLGRLAIPLMVSLFFQKI